MLENMTGGRVEYPSFDCIPLLLGYYGYWPRPEFQTGNLQPEHSSKKEDQPQES